MSPQQITETLAAFEKDPIALMALMMWREARSESNAARTGCGNVVINRCHMAPHQGFAFTPSANILKPYAFSSFNANDPQHGLFPAPQDTAYQSCLVAAKQVLGNMAPDFTAGAVFYHDDSIPGPPVHSAGPLKGQPVWGPTVRTIQIGRLIFYRIP